MASTSTSGRRKEERDPFLVLQPPNKKIKSPLTAKQYDVFINHRGPDTKAELAKPLYDYLEKAGVDTYVDVEETELGDYFPSAIKNAIFSARLHIAILSPRYAESPWCLAELALMFQTKARIIPLFYNVDPPDFRHIKNGVEDAFKKHQEKRRYPDLDIQRWKDCLQNVSGINGYLLNGQNDDLKKLCEDIMSAVGKEKQKRKPPFQVAKHEVGLDELAKDFHSHCQRNGQMGNNIIGIYGMGGSGKTTLDKYLFNRKHSEFSRSTILFDVREKDVKGNLTLLQQQLVNDLKGNKNEDNFCSTEDGIAIINEFLENSKEQKFLIVIDDVDHQRQLDALLPTRVLNPDSLVIVTTRDKRLLINAGVTVLYKMKKMNAEHSRELFCRHAFDRQHCKIGFEDLVDSFVEACGGLPLALQVMGRHVFGSDKAYWKLQLDAVLKARLHKDIRDTLKISYDSLEEDEKQVFMDLACFFIGVDVSMAMSVWKASGWRAEHALQTLKDKCLAEVETCFDVSPKCHYEPRFFLRMHDQLRDLGRAMADNETTRRRRLWRPEDHIAMNEIKGFQDGHIWSAGESFRCYRSASNLERNYYTGRFLVRDCHFYEGYFLEISKTSTYAQSLILNNAHARGNEWIPEWICLQNLHSLSLYGLSPARLLQRDNQVSLKLKELYCSFGYVPDVNKDMLVSELVSSFGTFKHLESLHLRSSLNLSIEWNQLLKSVRDLTNLQTLDLRTFTIEGEIALSNRGETTDDRLCMRSLEAITLCLVCETTKVSIHGQFCPTLKSLKLCSMDGLIEVDLRRVTTLECLVLLDCGELRKVLGNDMAKLEMFHIRDCCTLREFPNFELASSLKRIYISHCDELQDISGIERLKGLKRIWIAYCPKLKSIKAIEQLKGLKRIWIQECPQLEGVICFKELKELKRIFIGGCTRLQNIQGIEYLSRLESIIITTCPKLQNISGIAELEALKEMIIAVGPIVSYVQRLQKLASECTILVGKLASDWHKVKWTSLMSDLRQIGDIWTVGYDLVNKEAAADEVEAEAEDEEAAAEEDEDEEAAEEEEDEDEDEDEDKWESLQERIKKMRDSFRENQRSLSMVIICIVTYTINCRNQYPSIGSNICNGSNIRNGSRYLFEKSIDLIPGCSEYTLYTAIVDDCRRSEYESWMPLVDIRRAFIMGVEAGEERKTLQILQRIITQVCVDDCDCSEDLLVDGPEEEVLPYGSYRAEYDELAEYADDDEKYDGTDDDEEYNIHAS